MILRPTTAQVGREAARQPVDWIAWLAAGLVVGAFVTLGLRIAQSEYEPDASRHFMLMAIGLPIVGLVLIEQVFRNLSDDLRWLAKPICVGLACVFAFDLYLYAEGALLGRLDRDVLAIRPVVQFSLVPLLPEPELVAHLRRAGSVIVPSEGRCDGRRELIRPTRSGRSMVQGHLAG